MGKARSIGMIAPGRHNNANTTPASAAAAPRTHGSARLHPDDLPTLRLVPADPIAFQGRARGYRKIGSPAGPFGASPARTSRWALVRLAGFVLCLAACGVVQSPSYVRSYGAALVPTPDGSAPEQIVELGPLVFTTTDAHRPISQAPLGAAVDAVLPIDTDAFHRCSMFTRRWEARVDDGPWVTLQDDQFTQSFCGADGPHGIHLYRARAPRLVEVMPQAHADLPGPDAPYRFATFLAPQLHAGDNHLQMRVSFECHDADRRVAYRAQPGVLTVAADSRTAIANYQRIVAPRLVGSGHPDTEDIEATALEWASHYDDVVIRRAVLISDGWERGEDREQLARLLAIVETEGQCEATTLTVSRHRPRSSELTYILQTNADDPHWPYPCRLAPEPDPSRIDVLGSLWWPRDWDASLAPR